MQIADDLLGIHPRFHRISESRTIYLRLTDFFRRLLASIIVKRLSVRGSAIGARTRACLASERPSQTHMPTLKIVIITNAENIRRAAVAERQREPRILFQIEVAESQWGYVHGRIAGLVLHLTSKLSG